MYKIFPIHAFNDNFIWVIQYQQNAIIIDPGNAEPVIAILKKHDLSMAGILITHHHQDHVGGVEALLTFQNVPVYAPSYGQYAFPHQAVTDNNQVTIGPIRFKVMWVPGHTQDHIAYQLENHLFIGDTVFGAGCGRVFDGSLKQLYQSIQKIKQLDSNTQLYCAHEYTEHNIQFALSVDPDNKLLIARASHVSQIRKLGLPSIPSTIKDELETNPFFRDDNVQIKKQLLMIEADAFSVFCHLRELRNHY
jgi:hydroxyacylglutathione hydrolase